MKIMAHLKAPEEDSNIRRDSGHVISVELEPLSNQLEHIDYDLTLNQALVNEGKHLRVLNSKLPDFNYNDKQLREEAAAEVAQHSLSGQEDGGGKNSSRKRKIVPADAKAQQNRDRNREHAKNTRLRKKAYIRKLKDLVNFMAHQKDQEEIERKALGVQIYDTNVVRKNAVRLFLSYRSANIRDRSKWATILDESFVFTLPITPYRSFHKRDIAISGSRVLTGIDAAINDTASLALMVESFGQGGKLWKESIKRGQRCRVLYKTSNEQMHAAGNVIMCRYRMQIEGFEEVGASFGCVQHGMLQVAFNANSKIMSVEMVFDVMGFMQQLQRATAISPESSIIPNTVDMALHPSKEARAIIKSDPPLLVIHINEAWTAISGLSQSVSEGLSLAEILRLIPSQGQLNHLQALAANCRDGLAGSAVLVTYNQSRPTQPALIYLKLIPLTTTSDSVTHMLGVQVDLPISEGEENSLLAQFGGVHTTHLLPISHSSGSGSDSSISSQNNLQASGGYTANTARRTPALVRITPPFPSQDNTTACVGLATGSNVTRLLVVKPEDGGVPECVPTTLVETTPEVETATVIAMQPPSSCAGKNAALDAAVTRGTAAEAVNPISPPAHLAGVQATMPLAADCLTVDKSSHGPALMTNIPYNPRALHPAAATSIVTQSALSTRGVTLSTRGVNAAAATTFHGEQLPYLRLELLPASSSSTPSLSTIRSVGAAPPPPIVSTTQLFPTVDTSIHTFATATTAVTDGPPGVRPSSATDLSSIRASDMYCQDNGKEEDDMCAVLDYVNDELWGYVDTGLSGEGEGTNNGFEYLFGPDHVPKMRIHSRNSDDMDIDGNGGDEPGLDMTVRQMSALHNLASNRSSQSLSSAARREGAEVGALGASMTPRWTHVPQLQLPITLQSSQQHHQQQHTSVSSLSSMDFMGPSARSGDADGEGVDLRDRDEADGSYSLSSRTCDDMQPPRPSRIRRR